MEGLKQHYLDEMLSLSNDLGIKDYRNEKNDIHFRRDCKDTIHELKGKFNEMSIEINKRRERQYLEQVVNLSSISSQRVNSFSYDDDDDYDYEESSNSLNETISQEPSSIANTPILLTLEPGDSLKIGNEELSTILEKELDAFIKSSVEDLIPIPSESEDTSGSDKSLSDEDISEDNVKIYSNPLLEIDDEYISSEVNPLFDEVLENIESKDSYDFNLDEPDLLVTPLFEDNKDECFDSGGDVDEINDFEDGYYESEGDILYLEIFLSNDTTPNLPHEVFLDRDLRSLSDAPIDNLIFKDKVFDPGICERKPKKDKSGSKSDKNGKRGEARKSQKQLQWIKQGKLKKL
uniref:Uncharacterized protein n=1 Tax=Tanacetum cinerariifolium TaxID=118510 RepID=A0A6L2MMG4_TANCI|nr:hypothetical protein [Tanacetum cinerariifolium]